MEFFEGILIPIIASVAFAIAAPIVGCLLAGIDRVLSARMQGRVGPPLLQPYYDVRKLLAKERVSVNTVQGAYVVCALVFACLAGGIFFSGGNLLMCVFVITLSSLFFIIAAYSSRSPYAELGAAREMLQVMAYEPMVLLFAVAFCMATAVLPGALGSFPVLGAGSFDVATVFRLDVPVIACIWPVFLGMMFILTIKLRKSPFDLSMSHHAHQELVKGLTTEFSGKTLSLIEIAHWYENVFLLGFVFLFFANGTVWGTVIGVVVCLLAYFLEVLIDNSFARMKWQVAINSAWIVALVLGMINLFIVAMV